MLIGVNAGRELGVNLDRRLTLAFRYEIPDSPSELPVTDSWGARCQPQASAIQQTSPQVPQSPRTDRVHAE